MTGGPDGSLGSYPLEGWGAISLAEAPPTVPSLPWGGSVAILIGLMLMAARALRSPATAGCASLPAKAPEGPGQRGRCE